VLAMTGAALAQAGTAPGSTAAPKAPAESQAVPQSPRGAQQPSAPSGCPYRDGKLELIV
jgi:hypothetical protein